MGKFKFEKVGGQKKYIKYSEHKAGDLLVEGTYTGRSASKFGNDGFAFRPTDGGPTTVLNHTGQLSYLMDEYIGEGDVVQVYYKGTSTIEKGPMAGKEAHGFEIQRAMSEVVGEIKMPQRSLGLHDLD